MKANFRFVLRTGKKDSANRSPIFLRVTSHYRVKFISTGRKIQERFWNKDREQVRSSHPNSVEVNQYLEDFLKTAREKFRQSGFDIGTVTKNTVVPDVISFIDKLANDHNKPEQFRTRQKYITLKNGLIEFAGTKIPFDRISKAFVIELEDFLRLSHSNKLNTRIAYLKMLRRQLTLQLNKELPQAHSQG